MSSSEQLRLNTNQHKSKLLYLKNDDKSILVAQQKVQMYLENRFEKEFLESDLFISFEKAISYKTIYEIIKKGQTRYDFDIEFAKRTIKPDGGVLYLMKKDDPNYKKVLLIAEVKKQGTNDQRQKEGKKKQAQGNAIERLGKNLTGIRAMLNHEKITPFVCFGWGCDFDRSQGNFVLSKVSMLNEFYQLNKIFVNKKDGSSNRNYFAPVSMYFRKEVWTIEEMFAIMKEIAETATRHYLF